MPSKGYHSSLPIKALHRPCSSAVQRLPGDQRHPMQSFGDQFSEHMPKAPRKEYRRGSMALLCSSLRQRSLGLPAIRRLNQSRSCRIDVTSFEEASSCPCLLRTALLQRQIPAPEDTANTIDNCPPRRARKLIDHQPDSQSHPPRSHHDSASPSTRPPAPP